jgi:hypothetical protein
LPESETAKRHAVPFATDSIGSSFAPSMHRGNSSRIGRNARFRPVISVSEAIQRHDHKLVYFRHIHGWVGITTSITCVDTVIED